MTFMYQRNYMHYILYVIDCTDRCVGGCNGLTGCDVCQPGYLYPDCNTGE